MGDASAKPEATRLAMLARMGMISQDDYNRLGEITLRHCRMESAKQVRAGVVPVYDYELCAVESAGKCFSDGLAKFDPEKSQWGTFCQRICANFATDMARERTRQAMLKIRLLNQEAELDNPGGVDYSMIVPSLKIRRNPEAMYDWDQQLGKWQVDGIVPTYADLQALKKRIMQEYNL
ncbi:MAG: hypothetical protein ACI4SG_00660 [Oligosphaeraceae bacterium]